MQIDINIPREWYYIYIPPLMDGMSEAECMSDGTVNAKRVYTYW